MANHCENCEYSNDCEIAYITEFCENTERISGEIP